MLIAPYPASQRTTRFTIRFPRLRAMNSQNGHSEKNIKRRKLSYQDGRAVEMLGHAIEYLADEYVLECRGRGQADHSKAGPVQAIELLMARNREIYLAGELVPTFTKRLRLWLRFARA